NVYPTVPFLEPGASQRSRPFGVVLNNRGPEHLPERHRHPLRNRCYVSQDAHRLNYQYTEKADRLTCCTTGGCGGISLGCSAPAAPRCAAGEAVCLFGILIV